MKKNHYKIVEVNTLPDFLVFSTLIAKSMGAKIILDMHEVMPEFFMSKYKISESHFMTRLLKFQERLSFNFADMVLTINKPIAKLLESRGLQRKKIVVVTNSADATLFSPKQTITPQDKFVFMYHGTLTPIYGLDIAIRAFSQVSEQIPDAELWLIGDGPESDHLKELCKKMGLNNKVNILNSVSQEQMPDYLALSSAGVLPTRQDVFLDLSFSNKLSEYILMEKPVIISRLKTINTYFSDDALIFFEPENAYALANCMVEIYDHPEKAVKYVNNAKKEYASISWAVMKQRYIDIISKLS